MFWGVWRPPDPVSRGFLKETPYSSRNGGSEGPLRPPFLEESGDSLGKPLETGVSGASSPLFQGVYRGFLEEWGSQGPPDPLFQGVYRGFLEEWGSQGPPDPHYRPIWGLWGPIGPLGPQIGGFPVFSGVFRVRTGSHGVRTGFARVSRVWRACAPSWGRMTTFRGCFGPLGRGFAGFHRVRQVVRGAAPSGSSFQHPLRPSQRLLWEPSLPLYFGVFPVWFGGPESDWGFGGPLGPRFRASPGLTRL